MPFPGLTRLEQAQVLTPEIWNDLMDLLEAKFSGSVGGSDIQWPFITEGDIDFGGVYGILGLRRLWGIINAGEYASLDAAISAAESDGGGIVLIPPDTTITANNVSIDSSNVMVVGCGPSSVVQITASSTNPLFTTAATGLSGIGFSNLTLDGTGGGAGVVGIRARRTTRLFIDRVYFNGFTGDHISLTNDGVAGNACIDTRISNVFFNGGSDSHLFADDVSGLTLTNFISKSATGNAIDIVPASSSHLAQDITIGTGTISSGGAKGIRIIGSGAAAIDAHSRIDVRNVRARSMTGVPFELGNTSTILKDVTAVGLVGTSAVTDGLRIAASNGEVVGCKFTGSSGDGIDMTNSTDLWVHGNDCQDAGAYGVNATSTTDCTVVGNNLRDAVTDGILRTSNTGLRAYENVGDDSPTVGSVFYDNTTYTKSGAATGDMGFTYTIPANTLKTGDMIRVRAYVEVGADATGTIEARFNAVAWTAMGMAAGSRNLYCTEIRAATGGGNSSHVFSQITSAGTAETVNVGGPVVDWTIDQALTFNLTAHGDTGAADTVDLRRVIVEFLGSK